MKGHHKVNTAHLEAGMVVLVTSFEGWGRAGDVLAPAWILRDSTPGEVRTIEPRYISTGRRRQRVYDVHTSAGTVTGVAGVNTWWVQDAPAT